MTKIIAELGINHDGSFLKCKKMIDQSFTAGCWGIKFQYRNLDKSNNEIFFGKLIWRLFAFLRELVT